MLARIVSVLVIFINVSVVYAKQPELTKTTITRSAGKNLLKLYLNLQLVDLKTHKSSEKVDELYMAVTVYPSRGRSYHHEVPAFPKYWLSSHVGKIKNLSLWRGVLRVGESVTVQLSLIERDVPPFDTDDLVATVVARAKNDNGKLVVKWKMANKSNQSKNIKVDDNSIAQQIELMSEEAHYTAGFTFADDSDAGNK